MLPFQRHTAQEAPFREIVATLRRVLGPSLEVRATTQADDARVHAFVESLCREFALEPAADRALDAIDTHYGGQAGILVLLEKNGEIVGTFGAKVHRGAVVEFEKIFLSPSLRGQGLGSTVFHCFMGLCLKLGYPSVILETHPNFKVANAFYRSAGFRPARLSLPRMHAGTEWLRFHFSDPV